jgi:hypothetical protein
MSKGQGPRARREETEMTERGGQLAVATAVTQNG